MIIGISGMIGSGKSTLAKGLVKHYKKSILLEEFQEDDEVFNTFLKWLYEKRENINIGFQSYIIESLSDNLQKCLKEFKNKQLNMLNNHIFLDRFNLEHYIFAKVTLMNKNSKYLKAFDALFNKLVNKDDNPDLAIFININFETFKKRLFLRNRKSEIENYYENENYFKLLHSMYLSEYKKLVKKYQIPYVVIETDDLNDKQVLNKAIEIIDNFKKY
ncbi:deoxynucleoside kinase [Mycoplasmopsis lipofaciens]|uniref:deoxynucleoside kinase n=1 Tax=Mycoplasmopsis lipofaciens TaxID=114884 RepID=UPI000483EEFA|nr:deoxynucleoside kinase [Mycoplasmopsis lipofaciens]